MVEEIDPSEDVQRVRLQVAVKDFITAHEMNGSSVDSLAQFRNALGAFTRWVTAKHNIEYVDALRVAHLREWLTYLQKTPSQLGKPFADQTIHQYGSTLRAFCNWLYYEETIQKSITERFTLPKVEKKFIPAFTIEDFHKLLDACEEGSKKKPKLRKALTARNRAIVTILFDAGLRRSELLGLRLGDIDRELRLLTIHRKGNKWQQVPITQDGYKPLNEYITKHRPYLASLGNGTGSKRGDAVFLGAKGEPFKIAGIEELFKRLKERTGIDDKRVSSHQGRRYMATTQLAAGRSPLDVQRQMGHTTLQMTNHYASLTTTHIKKSHELYAPLRPKESKPSGGNEYWEE